MIEMQEREKTFHNRIISNEATILRIKHERDNLEVTVNELSSSLKEEVKKREKLEQEMELLKSQLNAIFKSLHS